ncbi:MAG: DNA polymerase III subunit delta [Alphaproteobacteria bacterium]|nr:DNA polymerase III subunit delta [Alphaproteobacteria bacterium]
MIYKAAQIDKYLKKPEPGVKAFLVYGSNEGLIAEYVRKLTATVSEDLYDPFCVVYLNGADVNSDPGLLSAEYNSRSLMGGRRVIIVRDADNNLTKQLKPLFESSESDTLVIIYSSSLNKKSSLTVWADGADYAASIACYEDRDEDIFSTARSMFIENSITIGNEALQLLCARLSNDRKSNVGEIEKLITYLGDKRNVTLDDIKAAISDQSTSNTDDVCYYTAGGNSEKSQKALQRLLNEGEEPITIVRALSNHFNRLITCRSYMENGETADNAVNKLVPRLMFYRVSSFKRQLAIWPRERLFSVMELLYKCERDCKTTNYPSVEILSYCLMQVSSAAAKLGKSV